MTGKLTLGQTIRNAARINEERRAKTLDKALLQTKEASEKITGAKADIVKAIHFARRVNDILDDDTKTAKDKLSTLMGDLEHEITELKEMQTRIAAYDPETAAALVSLDSYAMASLSAETKDILAQTKAPASRSREEAYKAAFSKAVVFEALPYTVDDITCPEISEDMSVEAIMKATLGPLRSSVEYLQSAIASRTSANDNLMRASELLYASQKEYKAVSATIDGSDTATKALKGQIDGVVAKLEEEMTAISTLLEAVKKTVEDVGKAIGDIDNFAVITLRTSVYPNAVQDDGGHDVQITPPPVSNEAAEGHGGTQTGAKRKKKTEEMTAGACVQKILAGEKNAAVQFASDKDVEGVQGLLDELAMVINSKEVEPAKIAVDALAAIAQAPVDGAVALEALTKLQLLNVAGMALPEVKSYMTATLGALEIKN